MPAPDPDLTLRLAKATADLYGDATATMLEKVARRLARGITEPGWAGHKLTEVAQLRQEAMAEVQRLAVAAPETIRTAVEEAASVGAKAAASELGVNAVPSAVQSLVRETVSQVTSTHLQLLRRPLDIFRSVIAEAGAAPVAAGTETRLRAAQRVLDRFARSGVAGFVDRAGRSWEIESYAEMAVRTASGRAHVQGRLDVYQSDGRDLVIVSDAPQECSVCRPWEGRILSISGNDRTRPSLAEATASGLFHANCRHDVRPYVAGLTKPFTHTADPDGDRARQEQRYLERGVRRWKRAEVVGLDDEAKAKARARVQEWQGRLREHVDANDLKRLRQRERLGAR